MKTVLKVFERAVAAIEKYGWVQGMLGTEEVGFCAIGAMDYATPSALIWSINSDAVVKLQTMLGRSVAEWNDAPGRTKEEVLVVFRKAIENERISPSD